MKFFVSLFAMLAVVQLQAQTLTTHNCYVRDPNASPREHNIDIERQKLEVEFEPAKGLVKGKVTHSFTVIQKQVDSIFFDGPGIRIQEASLDAQTLRYKTNAEGIWVYPAKTLNWDEKHFITFVYECNPRKGIYFIGWHNDNSNKGDAFNRTRNQIWTQGQGIDNRHWIPSYDTPNDKMLTEVLVKFDKEYQVLSNGTALGVKDNKDGTKTWHYSMTRPHASYLLMLGIGKYAVKSTKSTASKTPVHFWYYPEFKEKVELTSVYTERMVDFMENETGMKYPWESYSQIMVQEFLYGAMENTTATIFGDFMAVDQRQFIDKNYIGVNCHEFVHQWFGDFITARTYNDTWLQESYATYYPKKFFRQLYGDEHYEWQKRGEQNSALDASKKDRLAVGHSNGGTARVYPKGSFVIGMLNYVLGEEQYKRGLNHYLKNHAYGNVQTNDLMMAFHDKLGITLDWFFDQWIYRGAEPHYEVNYQDIKGSSRYTQIHVKQIHQVDEVVGYFKMPVVFEVNYTDGSKESVKEWVQGNATTVHVPNKNNKEIAFVLFDPGNEILRQLTFKKSTDELKAQALKAAHMIDRYDALLGLREVSIEEKRQTLVEVFNKETFHATRNEVISQLAKDKDGRSLEILRKSFSDKDVNVRQAVINAVDAQGEWVEYFKKSLTDSSYNVIRTALTKLGEQQPAEMSAWLQTTDNLYGHNHDLRIKWLELAIRSGKDNYKEELIGYSSRQFEFRTRNASFTALKSLNLFNEQVAINLLNAAMSPNGRLKGPAVETLQYFMQQSGAMGTLKQHYNKADYSAEQKDLIKKSGINL
ncbi:MAG TPA: M1 family metallopeptidase [Bacteroidia bacterium]|nr:M1 family metallopeptidase [Bacteroidia bacterium]